MSLGSRKDAPAAPEPVKDGRSPHLIRCEQGIAELSKQICYAMYCDTIEEARKLLDLMKNDAHVMGLRAYRSELEFLQTRKKQLEAK